MMKNVLFTVSCSIITNLHKLVMKQSVTKKLLSARNTHFEFYCALVIFGFSMSQSHSISEAY